MEAISLQAQALSTPILCQERETRCTRQEAKRVNDLLILPQDEEGAVAPRWLVAWRCVEFYSIHCLLSNY